MNTREKAERILAEIAQSDHSDPLDVAGVCQAYLTQRNEVLAAERLCKIYFQIAADAIGEEAVIRIRDYEIRSLKDSE